MLNKNDVVPLYYQLEKILRDDIIRGVYKDGDMIPSETQMIKKYNVTRTTVRKAISNLVIDGLLKQVHGKGTFVCLKQTKYKTWNFSGFSNYLSRKNETPKTKVLKKEIITQNDQKYLLLVRARGVKKELGDIYLTIDTSQIPLSIFSGIEDYDFSKESLYNIMNQKYNISPKSASLGIYPIMSDKLTKEIFNYKKDIPLLKAEGSVFSESGLEIEKVSVIYGPNMEFKAITNIED